VQVETDYGQEAGGGRWLCPQREVWRIGAHQKLTTVLQDRLCFTVTATGAYGSAAELAGKWGCPLDDSTLPALAQRVGQKAREQARQRLKNLPPERESRRKPSELGVLLLDGWQVRHCGPGWGAGKIKQNRVEWHEMKLGVDYQIEQAAKPEQGRGALADKVVVSSLGEPVELGQRLHWEALRAGLSRTRHLEMLGDGAHWIWNLKQDRWARALEVLDFYHGSEHLWNVGRAIKGEAGAAAWVEPRLHQLRHGREKKVLKEIAGLHLPKGQRRETVRREQSYFAGQGHRMRYQEIAARGWPIGSGAVESACRQRQCRFKRPGQFWTAAGLQNLCALADAKQNHHWEELWP
jgi:hypothetical protein